VFNGRSHWLKSCELARVDRNVSNRLALYLTFINIQLKAIHLLAIFLTLTAGKLRVDQETVHYYVSN